MSGFGRPSAGIANSARGVKVEFLREHFRGVGPFGTIRDVCNVVTQSLNNDTSASIGESHLSKPSVPTWCEKMKVDAIENIGASNLHVIVSAEDLFFNTLSTIERAISSNMFDSIASTDSVYVYFTFLDDRKIGGNNVQMALFLNGQLMSKISNCLLILSRWQETPAVLQEHLCIYSLFQARAQKIVLILSSEALEKSLVSAIISQVDSTYSTFLSILRCSPNINQPGLATIEKAQAIQASIIEGNPDTVKQYKNLTSQLRKIGGEYVIFLLRKHLGALLPSVNSMDTATAYKEAIADEYDGANFALIRVLHQEGQKAEAIRRNEELLQRMYSQLDLLLSNADTNLRQNTIPTTEKMIKVLLSLTDFYSKDLRFSDVQTILSRFVAFISPILGDRHLLVLRILKDYGACHRHLGKYSDALNILQSVQDQLQALMTTAATSDPDTLAEVKRLSIECLVEVGCCQKSMQQKDEARRTFTEILQIARDSFSASDPLCLQIETLLMNLNGQSMEELTHIGETHGIDSMEYRDACYRIGMNQRDAKNPALAAHLLGKAYEISVSLDVAPLKTTSALQHHALALIDCGEIDEGVGKLRLCYEMRRDTQGPYDVVTIRTLYNIGNVLYKLQRYDDALQVLHQCLTLVKDGNVSPTHDLVSTLHISLANIFEKQGHLDQALVYAEMSYRLSLANSGETDPATIARYQHWVRLQGTNK